MTRYALATLSAVWLFAAPAHAETCRTVTIPEQRDGCYGPCEGLPGYGWAATYHYPPGASRVGLEFWHHSFPPLAPEGSQWIALYIYKEVPEPPETNPRRILFAVNRGPEAGTGWSVNFPLSIFLNEGEYLGLSWTNQSDRPQYGTLHLTLRECYP